MCVLQQFILITSPTDQLLVSWPIAALRRYGVNNVSLTIVTGRYFCRIVSVAQQEVLLLTSWFYNIIEVII